MNERYTLCLCRCLSLRLLVFLPASRLPVGLCLSLSISVSFCLSLPVSAGLCLSLPVTLFSRFLSPRPALPGITVDDDDIIRRGEEPGAHHVAGTPCH